MAIYKSDIVDIDLETGSIYRNYLNRTIGEGDTDANRFGVHVLRNGAEVPLDGVTCTGYFIRSAGDTVVISGTVDGSDAYVTVPQACYAYDGQFSLTIKLAGGGVTGTMRIVDGVVANTTTGTIIDPGTIMPSVETLLAEIEAAVESIPADYSSLWETLAKNYSTSATYGIGDCVTYDGKLYRCVSNIESGESWTAAHWEEITVGEDIAATQTAVFSSGIDVLRYGDEKASYSNKGVTAKRVGPGIYDFDGEISGSAFFSYFQNSSGLPYWLEKGKQYALTIKGATAANKVYFEVLGYVNGTQSSLTGYCYEDGMYLFTVPNNLTGVYVRIGWLNADSGTQVDETIEYHLYKEEDDAILTASTIMHTTSNKYSSCDDIPANTIVFVSSNSGVLEIADFPFNRPGTLVCLGKASFPIQYAFQYNTEATIKCRSKAQTGWTPWRSVGNPVSFDTTAAPYSSCDDIMGTNIYFISSNGGVLDIPDAPFIGWLQTVRASENIGMQIMYPYKSTDHIQYRSKSANGWTSWTAIGAGSTTTTITQEVSRDTYNNTYNLTVSPQITTDTNGWLQAVDTDTSDETGKTDMTSAIMAMLSSTGYCHLGPGIFYVSGSIDMPAGSMIEGCGRQTIVRLLQSVESGYIVRMHTKSTLKNLTLSGGYSDGDISTSDIGGRKGINYIGNRDGQSTGVTPATCTLCMIEGCYFENLDSGFYGYNAGGGLQQGVEMVNCYFTRCKAGINIDYWTEYCKFTNCVTFQCYFGCINNGGNNVFTACTFHGVIGFVIDNSSGTKQNCAHGTVNGCTFNHIDNMNHPETLGNGYAVKVIDAGAGFIFSNCQFWYGKPYVESSAGVQFIGCEFGHNPVLETSGNNTVFFNGCLFRDAPTKTITSPVKFDNCYTYEGTAVTA